MKTLFARIIDLFRVRVRPCPICGTPARISYLNNCTDCNDDWRAFQM